MIEDGYTFRFKDWYCRPLSDFGREIARGHYESSDWALLDTFLWSPPHFYGDETKLSQGDKASLFSLMVETPVQAMQKELHDAVRLELTNPLLSKRSCAACKKWWFDPDTQLIAMRGGTTPILRPEHSVVPCDTNEGCPKGHYHNPIQFSKQNRLAWKHYLEWSSVGLTDEAKECPILRQNWRIIQGLVNTHGLPELCFRIL